MHQETLDHDHPLEQQLCDVQAAAGVERGQFGDALRDLEQVPLTTEVAQNGYFIDNSLRMLFKLVNDGFSPGQRELIFPQQQHDFWLPPKPKQARFDFDGSKQQESTATAVAERVICLAICCAW